MNRIVMMTLLAVLLGGTSSLSAQTKTGKKPTIGQSLRKVKTDFKSSMDTTAHSLSERYDSARHQLQRSYRKDIKSRYDTIRGKIKGQWQDLKQVFSK